LEFDSDLYDMAGQPASLRPLCVGLACAEPCWLSLLESEGLAVQPLSETPEAGAVPDVIVMPRKADARTRRRCGRLAAQGRTVVVELRRPEDQPLTDPQDWRFPYHHEDFAGLEQPDAPEAVRVTRGRCGKGRWVMLPFRLDRLWASSRVGKKHVVADAEHGTRLWHRQAWIVKKNVRRVVTEVLRQAFFDRGLPMVHTWYWPGRSRSVFCLRTDLDGGPRENLAAFIEALRPHAGSAAAFVCGGRCPDKDDLIREADRAGLEIGSHTFHHMVFPEGMTNRRDAARAARFLRRLDVTPVGLAAPAHFWHPSMYPPLAARGYAYACCFGLDHDNLPYYPVVEGRGHPMLEIPFHCLGDFFPKFGLPLDGEVARRFFRDLIAKKHAAGEPILLYGHADVDGRLGTAPGLVRFLCEQSQAMPDVWTGHLKDLAAWWKRRQAWAVLPRFDPESNRLACEPPAHTARTDEAPMLAVHLPDGSWRLVDAAACRNGGADVTAVPPQPPLVRPAATAVGELVRSDERPTLKTRLRLRRVALKRLARAYVHAYLRHTEAGENV
jgi:peptidoglycan/xylan/chitin deacetylase (PgdA/CDA1 family)